MLSYIHILAGLYAIWLVAWQFVLLWIYSSKEPCAALWHRNSNFVVELFFFKSKTYCRQAKFLNWIEFILFWSWLSVLPVCSGENYANSMRKSRFFSLTIHKEKGTKVVKLRPKSMQSIFPINRIFWVVHSILSTYLICKSMNQN